MPEPEVDDLDHAILRLLHEDARRSYADMAERVGLSTAATKRRVDRMRESGVIPGLAGRGVQRDPLCRHRERLGDRRLGVAPAGGAGGLHPGR